MTLEEFTPGQPGSPPMQNGWVNAGSFYYNEEDGSIFLFVEATHTVASGEVIFTLQQQWRPATPLTAGNILVGTDGTVRPVAAATSVEEGNGGTLKFKPSTEEDPPIPDLSWPPPTVPDPSYPKADVEVIPAAKNGQWLNAPVTRCDHDNVTPLVDLDGQPAQTVGRTMLHCLRCDESWWEPLSNIRGTTWAESA
jgi:hypothetical protein